MGPLLANSGRLSILGRTPTELSDEDGRIVRGLRAGISEAYEKLIDLYEHPVYAIVYRLLSNQTDAADVVQEVFLKVFRGVASFREESSLRTWIYRIAVNEARNHRRWNLRHTRHEISIDASLSNHDSSLESARDPGRSPYEQALESENRTLIEHALARINPVFRVAVVLRDIENLSYEEIAQILQISLGTVKSRILRGRESLRRELTERLEPGIAEAYT